MNNPPMETETAFGPPGLEAYDEAARYIRQQTAYQPRTGMVLGSGLGPLADLVQNPDIIPYSAIPHFPVSTALGHKGDLLLGTISGVELMVMQGRFHLYEGYSPAQLAFPVRVMHRLGVTTLILTNAAGGLNQDFRVGDIMLIEDHISLPGLAGFNPLRGINQEAFGERFPALNRTYTPHLTQTAMKQARHLGLTLQRGVYVYVSGPCFETPAEIRMLRGFGADAVGMSTVPEAMIARHAGMDVLAFSTITNLCIADAASEAQPDAAEVIEAAATAELAYRRLLQAILSTFAS